MKSNYKKLVAIVILYAVSIAGLLQFYEITAPAMGTWMTILTGLILIWYTWETMTLREISTKQLNLQLQPFVIYKNFGAHEIENIGNSVAMNISIENIKKGGENQALEIEFPDNTPFLKVGESASININVFLHGNKIDSVHGAHLNPKHAIDESILQINFENSEGVKFFVRQSVDANHVKFLDIQRKH